MGDCMSNIIHYPDIEPTPLTLLYYRHLTLVFVLALVLSLFSSSRTREQSCQGAQPNVVRTSLVMFVG